MFQSSFEEKNIWIHSFWLIDTTVHHMCLWVTDRCKETLKAILPANSQNVFAGIWNLIFYIDYIVHIRRVNKTHGRAYLANKMGEMHT